MSLPMRLRLSRELCLGGLAFLAVACSSGSGGGGSANPATADDAGSAAGPSDASSPGASDDASTIAPLDARSPAEASTGDAASDAGTDGSHADLTCGDPPARYTLLTGSDAGLVRDNSTNLVWMSNSVGGGEPPQTQSLATTYCTGRSMRLPTRDEAVALAASYAACAFGHWGTWTSTASTTGYAWVVDYAGDVSSQVADNFPSAVLCVRDP